MDAVAESGRIGTLLYESFWPAWGHGDMMRETLQYTYQCCSINNSLVFNGHE